MISVIRDAEADIRNFQGRFPAGGDQPAEGAYSGSTLWKNLIRSDASCIYWKDDQRRFLGVSKGFLEYFGLDSADGIIGKTDDEIGWHIHSDHVKNDELRLLREGTPTKDASARFLVHGVNRCVLYSSAPIYDEYGSVIGLVGSFSDVRRDGLTGLLNARGIAEEVHTYRDEYIRRNVDFMRFHVTIEDFASINQQYGFDHGDRVIAAVGSALRDLCGMQAALGRASGFHFVILRQFTHPEEALRLQAEIKGISSRLKEVDGIPCTLFLSVGMCSYSEVTDTAEQAQQAEIRLLADHNENTSVDTRLSRAGEIFRMYDHLPMAFSVYKVKTDSENNVVDAEFFYVNHTYAQEQGKEPEQLIGRTVLDVFPDLEPEWFAYVRRAALLGEQVVVDDIYFDCMKMRYYMTASQIIRYGYCAITYQALGNIGDRYPS